MKKFIINKNSYLTKDIYAFYNCDYVGYRRSQNPDFINKLKNNTLINDEMDLVSDFVEAFQKLYEDIGKITKSANKNVVVCVVPRSKAEKKYKQCQLMFKKAVSCAACKLGLVDGTNYIKRVKDTKTTHNWRMENNTGKMPYPGIMLDTCVFCKENIKGNTIVLVDDIYTRGVNIAEDCIQTLLDLGAKNVIMYVVAKTIEK